MRLVTALFPTTNITNIELYKTWETFDSQGTKTKFLWADFTHNQSVLKMKAAIDVTSWSLK